MANSPAIFSSLKGKKITLQGKFDRFQRPSIEEMIQLQQGKLVDDLDKSVDYLIVSDMASGMPAQRKAQTLNSKGASIQVLDVAALDKIACPTECDIIQIIRTGNKGAALLTGAKNRLAHRNIGAGTPAVAITGQSFEGLDLSEMDLRAIHFDRCSFANINGKKTQFSAASNCDFTLANLDESRLWKVSGSRFCNSSIASAQLGDIDGADFTSASMPKCTLTPGGIFWKGAQRGAPNTPPCFKSAILTGSEFRGVGLNDVNFDEANLRTVSFSDCNMQTASFRQSNLESAGFFGCHLAEADFSNANAQGAVFEGSDLSGARLDGANVADVDFSSAKTNHIDFSKAKNYSAASRTQPPVGPALIELDSIISQSKRIHLEFKVEPRGGGEMESTWINTTGLKHGWGIKLPPSFPYGGYKRLNALSGTSAMQTLASSLRDWKLHYETLEVSSSKCPKSNRELREIVLNAISEAFAQPLPPADELAKATKEWRDGINKATAKEREARKLAKEKEEKAKAAEKKKLAKKIEKEVGKVTDVATFLKALELRVDVEKIKKATKMLRAERFQLFNDVTDAHLNGVVKSQTDADLVYACRIEADGKYACCTQNLNICGGLRGSICKHLLVLIIGLVQAGKLDPQTIDEWVAKSLDTKAELNKETMGEIFIRYKGAEAGEVDWRPTETMPEDYYAL